MARHANLQRRYLTRWVLVTVLVVLLIGGAGALGARWVNGGSSTTKPAAAASGGPSTTRPAAASGTVSLTQHGSTSPSTPAASTPASTRQPPPSATKTSPPPTKPGSRGNRAHAPPPVTGSTSGPKASSITMGFTGDMLIHDQIIDRARADARGHGYDFAPMLAQVSPYLHKVDLAICHQETPISDNDVGVRAYPSFNAPHELAAAERAAGWRGCDTASNHTFDLGTGGIAATLGSLDAAGLAHTGSARSQAEADKLCIYHVKGVLVGHLAYTYGLNGDPTTPPWSVNLTNVARIAADAHRLKQAGADIVVVSVHGGIEQDQQPSPAELATDSQIMAAAPDVDLIVGAHAHVVQPVRKLADGRWVIYGVGNFLAEQQTNSNAATAPPNRDGVIIEPTFTRIGGRYRITKMSYLATFVSVPSDVVQTAPGFSHQRTSTILASMGAPVTDLTP